jgi:hypothetical protein
MADDVGGGVTEAMAREQRARRLEVERQRQRSAELLELMIRNALVLAATSEAMADVFETSAARGQAARRLALAAWERSVAAAERRNVDRLRSGARPLERLPRLPGAAATGG